MCLCAHRLLCFSCSVAVNSKELRISLIPHVLCLLTFILSSVVVLFLEKSLEEHNETMKNSVVEPPIINKVHSSNT